MLCGLLLWVAADSAGGQTPPDATAPAPEAKTNLAYRVSALLQGAQGMMVGFVDPASGQSFFIPEGRSTRGITVLKVDFAEELVRLEVGGVPRELHVTDDPASREVWVSAGLPPGEDEESFSDEELGIDRHREISTEPSAGLKAMMAQFPEAVPADFGFQPNAIEELMAAHPEVAAQSRAPQGSYGPGIELMLKRYPDLTNKLNRTTDEAPGREDGR